MRHLRLRLIFVAFSAVCGLLGLAVRAVAAPTEKLSLEDSLERAYQNNPRLLAAHKDIAIARATIRQARSRFFPKASLNLAYVRHRSETLGLTHPELGYVMLEGPPGGGLTARPESEDLYLGRLGFQQTLWSGGRLRFTLRRSEANLKRTETMYESVKRDVQFKTTESFFSLLALEMKRSDVLASLARVEEEAGRTRSARDRMAAMSARAELRRMGAELERRVGAARYDYLQSMGTELFAEIRARGTLETPGEWPALQTLLAWARENRAELKETQLQEEVDQLTIDLSLAERYPVFRLGGGIEMRDNTIVPEERNWAVGLNLDIPLFDGFSSLARIRETRHRAAQGQLRRVQLQDQVEREVRMSLDELAHWAGEVAARKTELADVTATGEEAFKAASLTDRLDYVRLRTSAALAVIDARFEKRMALARIERAIGRALPRM